MPKTNSGRVCFIAGAGRTRIVAVAGDPSESLMWHQRVSPVELRLLGSILSHDVDGLADRIRNGLDERRSHGKWFDGEDDVFERAKAIADAPAQHSPAPPRRKRLSRDEVRALIEANPGVDPADLGINVR